MTRYYARLCVAIAAAIVMTPLGASAACVDALLADPSPSVLHGTAGSSSSDIWAVGGPEDGSVSTIEHWDGSAWSIVPSPSVPGSKGNTLFAVTVDSMTDAWAAGFYTNLNGGGQSLVEHWDGISWTAFPQQFHFFLAAISIAPGDANSAWAVGSAVHCGNHCRYSTPFSEHWNGTRWRAVPVPYTRSSAELSGVLSLRGGTAWAVGSQSDIIGDSSHPLILHEVGGTWSTVKGVGPIGVPFAIAGTSESDIWIVGVRQYWLGPIIVHWNGASWTSMSVPHPNGTWPTAISETSATDIWIGGRYIRSSPPQGTVPYLAHFDGTSWTGNIKTPIGNMLGANNGIFSTPSGAWITGSDLLNPPSPTMTGYNSFAHC